MLPDPSRPFRFRRYGRAYHLLIEDVNDLEHVLKLDEGHWVATTAPINTINIDLMFLDLLDDDDDGRVRASEVKRAISWLFSVLTDTSGISNGNLTLQLDAINTETPDGKSIYDSAKEVLSRIVIPDKRISARSGTHSEMVRLRHGFRVHAFSVPRNDDEYQVLTDTHRPH